MREFPSHSLHITNLTWVEVDWIGWIEEFSETRRVERKASYLSQFMLWAVTVQNSNLHFKFSFPSLALMLSHSHFNFIPFHIHIFSESMRRRREKIVISLNVLVCIFLQRESTRKKCDMMEVLMFTCSIQSQKRSERAMKFM